jgi:hypothetical protein
VKPGIFDRGRTPVRQRAESCVEIDGNDTEHLLYKSHQHCQYLSRHGFLDIFAHISEYYTPIKPVTPFYQPAYIYDEHSLTHSLTHGAEPFLRSCQLCSCSRTSQHFMEPGGSSPRSHKTSTGPYPKPDRFNPYHHILPL